MNPQVIFVVYMDGDEEGMAEKSVANITGNEALSSLTAVKNGRRLCHPAGRYVYQRHAHCRRA